MNSEREKFEVWMKEEFDLVDKDYALESVEGRYLCTPTQARWTAWQKATAQAVPEGFVLIKDDTKTVVAIERMVEQQVEASEMDSRRLERLDGWKIIEAAVKAQEPPND